MIRYLLTIIILLGSTDLFASSMNFEADCWAACQEVKSKRGKLSATEFQRQCESSFEDGVVLNSQICVAPEYRLIKKAMPGTASNCPLMTPAETRRWSARCLREADRVWLLGREVGNCVSEKTVKKENQLCDIAGF